MAALRDIAARVGVLAVVAGALALSYAAGRQRGRGATPVPVVRTDTVTVVRTDTVTVVQPVPVSVTVVRTDTITVRDTVEVEVARVQRHYSDSLYDAWVSGIRPELDSLRLYPRTVVMEVVRTEAVTRRVPARWHLGVQAGYGVSAGQGGALHTSPYIGVGIGWSIASW